jgi:hypothetical protein
MVGQFLISRQNAAWRGLDAEAKGFKGNSTVEMRIMRTKLTGRLIF